MRIALVGTRGVPARYGGFETAVEEVGSRLAARGHEVVVYCRNPGQTMRWFRGMRLVNLPALRVKQLETLSHMALSSAHLFVRPCDVALVFNAANSPLLPLIRARGIPAALHMDGLEWRRAKWGRLGRRYYLAAERLGARLADALIADARGIQAYYQEKYATEATYLPYGARVIAERKPAAVVPLGVEPGGYHLVVARFEPENNLELILEGYAKSAATRPLIIVGRAAYASEHAARVEAVGRSDARVRLLGAVWDQELLDQLYANALTYVHGHSVGGTNPSLLRAMGAGAPVLAYDVVFNREVLGETGEYFREAPEVAEAFERSEANPRALRPRGERGRERVRALYDWDQVASGYEGLCRELVRGL